MYNILLSILYKYKLSIYLENIYGKIWHTWKSGRITEFECENTLIVIKLPFLSILLANLFLIQYQIIKPAWSDLIF